MSWQKWAVLLLLLLVAIAFPLAKTLTPTPAGVIEGFIVDEKGAPVPAASVEARNTLRGAVARGASKPDGSYRIDLASGQSSLWAEAKGYSCSWIPQVIVEEGKHIRQDCELSAGVHRSEAVPCVTTQ